MKVPLQFETLLETLLTTENGVSPTVIGIILFLWALSLILTNLNKILTIFSNKKKETIEDQATKIKKLEENFEDFKKKCNERETELQSKIRTLELKEAKIIGAWQMLAPQLLKLDIDIRPQLDSMMYVDK